MSCHTWSYKKVSALTDVEKQDILSERLVRAENWWGFELSLDQLTEKVTSWCLSTSMDAKQYAYGMLDFHAKIRDNLKEKGFDYIIEFPDYCEIMSLNFNNELYFNIDCDKPFRLHERSKVLFTDQDKLIAFLKTKDSQMIVHYDDILDTFIEGYTDGLVKSIEDYFEKHGKENLYFEFL